MTQTMEARPRGPDATRAARKMHGRSVRGELGHRKDAVLDAIDEHVHDARRAARKARFVTEDVVDIAAVLLRRHPFRSAAVAFTAGVGAALAAHRLLCRAGRQS